MSLPVRLVLMVIVAVSILPLLGFSVFLLMQYGDSQRERETHGLIVSAIGVARAIDAEFERAVATLSVLKNAALYYDYDPTDFAERLKVATDASGDVFVLIDRDGEQIVNTAALPRSPIPPREMDSLIEKMGQQSVYISDVVVDPGRPEPFAIVAVPIAENDQLKWILATILYSDAFSGVVTAPGVPDDWIVSIVDRQGTHIRRSHSNEQFAGHPLVPELLRHIAARTAGSVRTTSLEGIPLISTVAYAPVSGWAAALGLPVEAFEAPFRSSLGSLLITGVVLAAAALTLAFLAARILDRGLHQLEQSARSLGRGEIVEERPSAIREVNSVVATMVRASLRLAERDKDLRDLNDTLETQVSERTAELVAEMKRREESEAKLRQLQRIEAIGKLTGGIAHDFSNMLAVVMSGLSLVQRHLQRGDTDVQKFIDGAMEGAERAANLTRRLLAFSRQQELDPESVDCNKLISGIKDILRRTLPEHIEIETVLAGGLWQTYIDVSGLENAILNLVVNARDAMPDGGKLTIETSNAHLDDAYAAEHAEVAAGQYVMMAVSDTGSGIADEVLGSVFEPFFTTKELGQGTGLGLSQVHGFIKQSGGHVKIYSELDCGTTVKLYLPRLVEEPSAARERSHKPKQVPHAQNGETLLVVEDEGVVRSGTSGMLRELGYTVIEAESGEAALAALAEHPEIAMMITDVVMPGMNGRQLADEATKRRPELRVLFTSGYTRNAVLHNGTLDHTVHLIAKPYTLEALASKVADVLASPAGGRPGT